MTTHLTREIILVASARIRPMMGLDTLESLPSPRIPYALVDNVRDSGRDRC